MTRENALRLLLTLLLFSFAMLHGKAYAQAYVGGSASMVRQYGIGDYQPDYSACASATSSQVSSASALFAGYRFKYAGAEVGAGTLFTSRFDIDCPNAAGGQHIKASQQYARLNGYIPLGLGFDLVPFIGKARVRHTNQEEFITSGGEHLYNYTTAKTVSKLYGIGAQKSFDHLFVRVEYQRTLNVAEDYWTARGFHNYLSSVSIAAGYAF